MSTHTNIIYSWCVCFRFSLLSQSQTDLQTNKNSERRGERRKKEREGQRRESECVTSSIIIHQSSSASSSTSMTCFVLTQVSHTSNQPKLSLKPNRIVLAAWRRPQHHRITMIQPLWSFILLEMVSQLHHHRHHHCFHHHYHHHHHHHQISRNRV